MKIILASASPRRKELLRFITEDFTIRPTDADEILPDDINFFDAPQYLSLIKAKAAVCSEDELVIGCDTIVECEGKILGKPKDLENCFEMLKMLSGKTHSVYTGVTLIYKSEIHSFTECTDVKFYKLTDLEIKSYMDSGEPFDKAGGYGIQGRGALFVEKICGDYYNVVGLPVARLKREIDKIKSHH